MGLEYEKGAVKALLRQMLVGFIVIAFILAIVWGWVLGSST